MTECPIAHALRRMRKRRALVTAMSVSARVR